MVESRDSGSGSTGRTSVTIGVPTFRRPERLATLLPLLVSRAQELTGEAFVVDVLVVDNDPAESARVTGEGAGAPVRYVAEPTPGIAAARNRALDEAGTDLLAFIDDDEQPDDRWLSTLLHTWAEGQPAAVAGRVVATFDGPVDPWVLAGDFWQRPTMPTGSTVPLAACGNLLVDLRQQRALGVRFSARFALGGGEDIQFTRELTRLGGRIVWCDESVAYDPIPPDRATRRWVLRRAWSHGNVRATVALHDARGRAAWLARARLIGSGLVRTGAGLLRATWGLLTRRQRHQARGLRTSLRGLGMVAGAMGHAFEAYAVERDRTESAQVARTDRAQR